MNDNELKSLQLSLLQLQRSALIDTQTAFQLMIDKEICTVDEIVETRSKIESESADIQRIDDQIRMLGGTITHTPAPESVANKAALKQQLRDLLEKLKDDPNLL